MSEPYAPGFGNPILDSQAVFRAVLDAMSRPGRIVGIAHVASPEPLMPAAAAVCLTLVDFDTPLWLGPEFASAEVSDYLRFHCGAPMVLRPEDASFLICRDTWPPLSDLRRGTLEYPDRSATLIQQVSALGPDGALTFSGPGIDGVQHCDVGGLPHAFWAERAEACAEFPCGIDVIFAGPGEVMALPRTTKVEV